MIKIIKKIFEKINHLISTSQFIFGGGLRPLAHDKVLIWSCLLDPVNLRKCILFFHFFFSSTQNWVVMLKFGPISDAMIIFDALTDTSTALCCRHPRRIADRAQYATLIGRPGRLEFRPNVVVARYRRAHKHTHSLEKREKLKRKKLILAIFKN